MERSPLSRRTFLTVSSGALAAGAASAIPLTGRAAPPGQTPDRRADTGTGPKQSDEGVVYHRDIHRSDLMKGFPPPKDKPVTIDNWSDTTDTLRWTHLNGSFVFKTLAIEKADGPVWVLPRRMIDPEKLDHAQVLWGKSKQEAKRISVADWLRRSDTDALVVLHDGHIVAEQYFGEMTPYTPHRLWSASKSVLASILAPMFVNRSLVVGLFVMALLVVGRANGQGIPDVQHKALERLVGTWKCEDRCGDTVVKGDLISQWNADKTVLIWHWTGPLVTAPNRLMTSVGIMGWDGREEVVTEHCLASTGESFSASHRITADKWESPVRGTLLIDGKFQMEKSLRLFTFKSPDELQIVATRRVVDGKEQPDIVSTFTRVK